MGAADVRRAWRWRRAPASLLAVACACVTLAGCGGSGSQSFSGSGALLTTLENWSALQTPVDTAQGILTQQCMASHGYRFYPWPQNGQPGGSPLFASPLFGSSLWLGPQSLAWRIVNGWGLYEQTMQQLAQPGGINGQQPQESLVMNSLRGKAQRRYMKVLYGGGKQLKLRIPGMPHYSVQIGGCNTTAGAQLFGSVTAAIAVPGYGPTILDGTVQSHASRVPEVRASQATWKACVLARTRIRAGSPSQLFLHFMQVYRQKGPTPAVHRRELGAAVADLQCQRRSHLAKVVKRAALAAIRRLPGPVVGELETLLSALQQARSRAQSMFAHPAKTPALDGKPLPSGAGASSGASSGGSFAVVNG